MNIIATPKGGTHITGFERALTRAFSNALHNTRLLKNGDEVLKEDVLEGMTAVVTVRLAEPQFEGQTKEVLGTPAVSRLVTRVVEARARQISLLHQGSDQGTGSRGPGEGCRRVADSGRGPAASRGPAP